MNSLTLLVIATMLALAATARHYYLDYVRERRRNARLRERVNELLDILDEDVVAITDLSRQLAVERHPATRASKARPFTVIEGGAS